MPMFDDLGGKSALVTGASRGLGLHFAELLARHGVRVTLAARDSAALAAAQARIGGSGGSATSVELDVTDKASVEAAIASVPGKLDILVNNAGISAAGAALAVEEDDWDRVIDTNLKGSFLVAQAAARRMSSDRSGGAIVNIASILGLRVAGGVSSYAASKAGGHSIDQRARPRMGALRHPGQCALSGLYRDGSQPRLLRHRSRRGADPADPPAPPWPSRRTRCPTPSALLRRGQLHDRHDAGRRRRPPRLNALGSIPWISPSPAASRTSASGSRPLSRRRSCRWNPIRRPTTPMRTSASSSPTACGPKRAPKGSGACSSSPRTAGRASARSAWRSATRR